MKTLILILTSFLYTGCMHTMMTDSHNAPQSKTILFHEKEVTVGSIKADATFPQFEHEKEAIVTVLLSDKETTSPISKAEIIVHVTFQDQQENIEYTMKEDDPGMYTFLFTPSYTGTYSIKIEVLQIKGRALDQSIVIEDSGTVVADHNNNDHGGMHPSENLNTMLIVGGVVMGALMIGMLFWRY